MTALAMQKNVLKKLLKNYKVKTTLLLIFFAQLLFSSPLQDAINSAKPYSKIELGSGVYKGAITIDKPLSIVGKKGAKVIIKGNGKASVILLKSSFITLKNLIIEGSGNRRETFDSAIKGENINNITIKNCTIKDSLYGINLALGKNHLISSNTISSKKEKVTLRGDGLKFWYIKNSKIVNNTFKKVRDIHLLRCQNALFKNNRFISNRFATHIEMSKNIDIKNNFYQYNEVGVLFMGSKDINITNNKILSGKGVVRIGIVAKGGKDIVIKNNIIKYNAKGIYIDAKPIHKAKIARIITDNEISYNLEAFDFHAIVSNNVITHNKIYNNLEDVVKTITGYKNFNNKVEYNYWGKYEGFDQNHDNIGDTPYVVKRYFDKLYSYNHKLRFFYGSTVMALVDFLCEIAPFTKPEILLVDKKPVFKE